MKLSGVVRKVITLGRKVRKYYDIELPKWYPDYPFAWPGQEGPPPPKEEGELRTFLESLPSEMIYQLMLIIGLGSERFRPDDLPGSYEGLKQKYIEPEWAIDEMVQSAPLAGYLSDGLSVLKRHSIPVNDLPLEDTEKATA